MQKNNIEEGNPSEGTKNKTIPGLSNVVETTQEQAKESMQEKPFLEPTIYKTSQHGESISVHIHEVNPLGGLWFDDVENNEYCYEAYITGGEIKVEFIPGTEDQEIIVPYTCVPKLSPNIPKNWLDEKQHGNIIIDVREYN